MGYGINTPAGYYMNKLNKKKDKSSKFDGLLSPKQLRDLEAETELEIKPIDTKTLNRKVKESRGSGMNFHSPED